jgi:nitrite reductase (NADH) small subunit
MAEGQFVTVARVEDVPPGTVTTVRAGDEEIALVHCGGSFYATQNACIHLEGPLGQGHVEDDCLLTCPWHGWRYDVRTGENDFDLAIKLRTFEVAVEDGDVRVRV